MAEEDIITAGTLEELIEELGLLLLDLKRRAIGNYRAAIKQQDKTDVNLNITTKFKTFQGETLDFQNGAYALNIWDLLRRSDFYKSYANMYDQIKINSIRVKLTPIMFHTHQTTNVTGSSFLFFLYCCYCVG